jgi:hypothetical protein
VTPTSPEVKEWIERNGQNLITDGKCGIEQHRKYCELHQRKYVTHMPNGEVPQVLWDCVECKYQLRDKDETPAGPGHVCRNKLTKVGKQYQVKDGFRRRAIKTRAK